jgi:hypothetical protein
MNFLTLTSLLSFFLIGPSFGQTCEDSVLDFVITGTSRNYVYSCETDAADAAANNCEINGESIATHCPATCNATCADDTHLIFEALILKSSGATKNTWKICDWVNKSGPSKKCKRCARVGMAKTCPTSCTGCTPPSPTPPECNADSPLIFKYDNGKEMNCDIVRFNPELCDYEGDEAGDVKSHCPFACNVCNTTTPLVPKDSTMRFKVLTKAKVSGDPNVYKWKNCGWVNTNAGVHCTKRCERNGIIETCPEQCALC